LATATDADFVTAVLFFPPQFSVWLLSTYSLNYWTRKSCK